MFSRTVLSPRDCVTVSIPQHFVSLRSSPRGGTYHSCEPQHGGVCAARGACVTLTYVRVDSRHVRSALAIGVGDTSASRSLTSSGQVRPFEPTGTQAMFTEPKRLINFTTIALAI